MITGLVAAKLTNNIDMKVYNDKSLNLEKKQASAKEDL